MLALAIAAVLALGAGAMAPTNAAAQAAADLECFGKTATIVGTPGDDVIRGTSGPDVIVANRGDDRINGRGGDDLICGRSGDDKILGGEGDDRVRGWRGVDLIVGGSGNDRLLGGLQADKILGGDGDDILVGGAGSDECNGGTGTNHLVQCEVTPNEAPTDLTLAPTAVAENQPGGTAVGTLSAADPDTGDPHTFTLVAGTGSADNGSFTIVGATLRTAVSLDFETTPTQSVRIRATDSGGLSFDKALTITVTDVDDPPVAVDDTKTVVEDAAATAIDVLANDTDTDGGPKSVTSVTQPTHGTVVITGGGTGLTYAPNANYCNSPTPPFDTFTYTLNGGDVGAVDVTVTCVDDNPVAVDDSKTVAEDDAATAVDVLANDTDVDAGPKSIQSVTQPTHGTVVITGGGTGLTYAPNANYCNTPTPPFDTFTYTLTPGGSTATVQMTVSCVDDPPTAVNDSATVIEDAAAAPVPVLTNDTDIDGGPKTITSVTQPSNGTVAIIGGGAGLTYAPNPNYCNDPPGTTLDTFTYTLNGGSSATVSMTVTCADDAPVAVNDTKTVSEDDPATAVNVLANDTDVDGGPISISSVTQPANGTVVITGGGTGLTYQPNANYCNTPPGTTLDTFTYTLDPGGSIATVSVTVTCVDDAPAAVNDAATVAEDSGASPIDVRANDTDIDGGPKSVTAVTQPANGSVAITGGGTAVTYAPNANYCNTPPGTTLDTFTYTLNGGSIATVSVTVTCVDDPPVAVDDSATVVLGAPATAVAVLANDTDVDGGPMTIVSASDPAHGTVVITGGGAGLTYQPDAGYCNDGSPFDTFTYDLNGGSSATVKMTVTCDVAPTAVDDSATVNEDAPATAVTVLANDTDPDGGPKSIASVTQPANGAVVITGGGTGLTYQPNANYCNSPPPFDTFTYTLAPGGASATVSMTVTCVDDPPNAINDAATVAEDSAANPINVLANDTDVDGGPRSIASVTQPTNGTVAITGGGTGLSYAPNANFCGSGDSFTYTLTPGGSIATVTMTVTCVADAPVVTAGGALSYTENDPATPIAPALTVTDVDAGGQITGATVAITGNYAGAEDVLALANPVSHPGISAGLSGAMLTLTGTASPADYQSALRDVTYVNTSNSPSTLTRTVTFTVTDNSALSGSDTRNITVSAVDDPPTAVNDAATVLEDSGASAVTVLTNDTDVDGGPKSITSVTQPANGTVVITGGGTGLTYAPNANYCNTPTPPFDTFTYTLTPGGSSATVSMTVTCVNDAPAAVADSFDAIGNTGLFVGTTKPATQAGKEVTGSVLSNDTDVDSPLASLVAEPVTNAPTTLGGTITIEADGNFTYHPDDVDTGVTDTFTYRVCDATPCNSSTDANSTGTLSLPIAGQVWYVRNNEPAGGDGTSDTPFDTLAEAEAASGTGDTVYVFDGSNTTTNLDTGYAMNAGEQLIGESRPLAVDPDGGAPLPTSNLFAGTSGAQPTLTASNEDVVVLASNVLVDGVDVDPSGTGGGISGGAGVDAVTVQNANVTDTGTAGTQPGIEMDGTTGVNRFTGVTVTNGGSATAIGVRINNAGSVLFANTATNTIATTGAKALDAASTNLLTSRWNDITVTGSGTGAIRLNSTTGQPVLGDGAGTDLSLQTTSGASPALDIASSNTVTVDNAGTDTISATGGPAADIRNSNGSQFFFDSASSTNSAGDGINLDTNLTAPVVINAGTIAGAAGIAVDVNGGGGGGGTVTYAGAINDGSGQSIEVTGRDGGAVTLSGNIADSADAGGGVVVSGNSAGSTTLSGASKVLNTGAQIAVSISSNGAGTSTSFTNGGLDIDATSGAGLTATSNAGTVDVQGGGNSITTGTGRALNVVSTTIAAADLTFQSISANGAPSGIVLNTTGSAGNLVVTGSGGTCTSATTSGCSGGTIQNTTGGDDGGATPTGTGIVLNFTNGPSFTRMHIQNNTNYGIRGTSVAGFTLADSVVDGTNGTSALTANKDGSVRFEELTGTVSMTNDSLSGGYFTNLMVDNTTGTMNGTFDNVDSGTIDATGGDDAVQFEGIGTADLNVDFKNSAITTASGDLFQYIGDGTGGGDLDFTGNALTNNEPSINTGGGGVALVAGAKGAATMDVTNNTMRDSLTNALTVIKSRDNLAGTNNLVANITNNQIGVAATANSGSAEGDGMEITSFGDGNATFNVNNNTIRQYNSSGIQFVSGSGVADTGQVNLNISGNSIANPGTNPSITLLQGIRVDSGVDPGDTFATCVKFGANSITGSSDAANKDFRLVASQNTTIRQPGYAGGNTDGTAFAAFAASLIGGGAQGTAVANAPATFSGSGTTCP